MKPKPFDYLVVGAGLFGATFAQQLRQAGRRVLVIDKRPVVGGNCRTEKREGIDVHQYGAHIFHTNNERVWNYLRQFGEFNHYVHRLVVNHRGRLFSFPVNLMTLHQLWGVTTPAQAQAKLEQVRSPIANPDNLEDWVLSKVGQEIYETFIQGYTQKQWGRSPRELPAAIIQRIPVRLTYDDRYFDDRFQGIPVQGYSALFERLLGGIELKLGVDYFDDKSFWNRLAKKVVYTGPLDRFFDFKHGRLEYRSLRFEHEVVEHDHQGIAVMNYTQAEVPYTRVIEHKHFAFGQGPLSVITREFPAAYQPGAEPYYPVNDERNQAIARRYLDEARALPNLLLGGRLATYRYYDMHHIVASALEAASVELEGRSAVLARMEQSA